MYIYIYIKYIKFVQMSKYMYKKFILRFLPNLQRLDKITKGVKSINLKSN